MWIRTSLSALQCVADARCPFEFVHASQPVARGQSGGEGRGVGSWGGPDIADSVTDRCVYGEREVFEDTLHRGNHDGMDSASAFRSSDGVWWLPLLGRSAIISDAF